MDEEIRQNELQFHYFEFSSAQLYEDFCERTEFVVKQSLEQLEELLIAKFPDNASNIKEEIKNLEEVFQIRARGPLQKFKKKAKEIFIIPDQISGKVTSEQVEELKNEVDKLEEKYAQELFYRKCLQKKLKEFESIESLYNEVNKAIVFLEKIKPKPGEKSLQELLDVAKTLEESLDIEDGVSRDSSDVVDVMGLFKVE